MDKSGVRTSAELFLSCFADKLLFLLTVSISLQHTSLIYLGRRSRTKSDLSMKMYEEEMQVRNCRNFVSKRKLDFCFMYFFFLSPRSGTQNIQATTCLNWSTAWDRSATVPAQALILSQSLRWTHWLKSTALTNTVWKLYRCIILRDETQALPVPLTVIILSGGKKKIVWSEMSCSLRECWMSPAVGPFEGLQDMLTKPLLPQSLVYLQYCRARFF